MVDLKFTSGKIVQLKNMQHVPTIHKNLVSISDLLRDGFKVVLESNKVVMSKSMDNLLVKAMIVKPSSAYFWQIFVIR